MAGGPSLSWPRLLTRLLAAEPLSAAETSWGMAEILADAATPSQIAGFAVALRAKGETPEEISGLVDAMLAVCAPLPVPAGRLAVDTCGTGGDGAHTVNVSTMAALVVAAAGELVVKHGNRAASSACGSADVLEALGVVVSLPPDGVAACLAEVGIGFCFAPVFHPAMRFAAVPRRELGVPTFFNILGPLANPSRPGAQAVGVAHGRLAPVVAGVLAARGTSALVVRGADGLDEITLSGPTEVWEVREGSITQTSLFPGEVGLDEAPVSALVGGDAAHNAAVLRAVLAGTERGPIRDSVVVNAAAALVAAGPAAGRAAPAPPVSSALVGSLASPVSPTPPAALAAPTAGGGPASASLADRMRAAMERASAVLDDGSAESLLAAWVRTSRRLAP